MTAEFDVVVNKLPKCDFCESSANYDAKTKQGPWANMCLMHWKQRSMFQNLGKGKGQRLILEEKGSD